MTDDERDTAWMAGNRAAWARMLQTCLTHLGYDDVDARRAAWVVEREETVAKLRELCEDYGDNDWPDTLNLADVIEKHIVWDTEE